MSTTAPTPAPTAGLPLVVVGAGPIGLAAAAHAQARGLPTVVYEAGSVVGASVLGWGHVRLFSPWRELVDPAARALLRAAGWEEPDPDACPTGAAWVEQYLAPLAAALTATGSVEIRPGHRVVGVSREGRDRLVDPGRAAAPFTLLLETPSGRVRARAAAVLDASGTWTTPSPLGGDGIPAIGETEHAARIHYGIPDLADPAVAARYAGRTVAVLGRGASAQHVLVGLASLVGTGTRAVWLLRRGSSEGAFGGGAADELAERGALGLRARDAVAAGAVEMVTSFRAVEVTEVGTGAGADAGTTGAAGHDGRLALLGDGGRRVGGIDEVVVVTGYRPDLSFLGEVRLDLDPVLSAPARLAPLVDPNLHSCGTVPPHGAAELAQPEEGLYLLGAKSYGRAPSFLALTGFEQARSVVAAVAGDAEAAARVELVLPEWGVCGGSGAFDPVPTVQPLPDLGQGWVIEATSSASSSCCSVSSPRST